MAKAVRKDTTKSASAPTGSDPRHAAIGAPPPAQVHELWADDLEVGSARPADSPAQANTRRFLRDLMRRSPTPPRDKTKDDWRRECRERFGIPRRRFDRIWDEVIAFTGAGAYRKSGPRGPHKKPR